MPGNVSTQKSVVSTLQKSAKGRLFVSYPLNIKLIKHGSTMFVVTWGGGGGGGGGNCLRTFGPGGWADVCGPN
jgi:hypothetical protein